MGSLLRSYPELVELLLLHVLIEYLSLFISLPTGWFSWCRNQDIHRYLAMQHAFRWRNLFFAAPNTVPHSVAEDANAKLFSIDKTKYKKQAKGNFEIGEMMWRTNKVVAWPPNQRHDVVKCSACTVPHTPAVSLCSVRRARDIHPPTDARGFLFLCAALACRPPTPTRSASSLPPRPAAPARRLLLLLLLAPAAAAGDAGFGPYKIDAREVFHAMVNLRPLLPGIFPRSLFTSPLPMLLLGCCTRRHAPTSAH